MSAIAPEMNSAAPRTVSRVGVEIAGERYTIRGEADSGYISEVARLVDERMRELSDAAAPGVSRSRLAVLTAINLADELMQERMQVGDAPRAEIEEVAARTRQLVSLLDEGLIGDVPEL